MICPTCLGEAETRAPDVVEQGDEFGPPVSATPCMNCLGTGEVPDSLTLEDLLSF